ncbi:Homeodomain-like protein, partial [Helicostylum pulchrum]
YTAEDDNLSSGDEMYYGTPVRPRQRFSTEETSILERAFKETPRPSAEIKKDLAYQFGTVPSRIQIWFQNRRAKEKKIS